VGEFVYTMENSFLFLHLYFHFQIPSAGVGGLAVILIIWEAEIQRITVQGQGGKKFVIPHLS
jgi:hypothetical protein